MYFETYPAPVPHPGKFNWAAVAAAATAAAAAAAAAPTVLLLNSTGGCTDGTLKPCMIKQSEEFAREQWTSLCTQPSA